MECSSKLHVSHRGSLYLIVVVFGILALISAKVLRHYYETSLPEWVDLIGLALLYIIIFQCLSYFVDSWRIKDSNLERKPALWTVIVLWLLAIVYTNDAIQEIFFERAEGAWTSGLGSIAFIVLAVQRMHKYIKLPRRM